VTGTVNDFLAILPMRGGSERIPKKNLLDLAGKPLYSWILDTVLSIDGAHVVVDTDDDEIAEHVSVRYSDVQIVRRPSHLGEGTTPMNEVLLNTLKNTPAYSTVLQVHATNPFVSGETLISGVKAVNSGTGYDSAFSVTRLQARLWTKDVQAVNHDPQILLRTQDLDPLFVENSSFYVFERSVFIDSQNRIGSHPIMVEVTSLEAVDIDNPDDLEFARLIAPNLHYALVAQP
jgi:CMP-N-acetylneuraminic acid synthetase